MDDQNNRFKHSLKMFAVSFCNAINITGLVKLIDIRDTAIKYYRV